jgi:hypothetical protein
MFDLPMYWCEFDSRQQNDKTLRSESVRLSLIICRAPTSPERDRGQHDELPTVSPLSVVPGCSTCWTPARTPIRASN